MGNSLSNLTSKPWFWEAAFVVSIILLIGAHKISIEGMVE